MLLHRGPKQSLQFRTKTQPSLASVVFIHLGRCIDGIPGSFLLYVSSRSFLVNHTRVFQPHGGAVATRTFAEAKRSV